MLGEEHIAHEANALRLLAAAAQGSMRDALSLTDQAIAYSAGVHPIHFGIIVTMNLSIGLFTPPFGLNLFMVHALNRTPMAEVYRGVLPFVLVSLIALLVVALIATRIAGPAGTGYLQPLGAGLAWCAGFLGGRALAIASRIRRAPHIELRQF